MAIIEMLPWDTDVLGYPVARINSANLNKDELQKILQELAEQQVRLVYWAADSSAEDVQQAALACQGFLADKKTTYVIDLEHAEKIPEPSERATLFIGDEPTQDLYYLARESGKYSRFRHDMQITNEQFELIYHHWIRNSVRGIVAKQVLIYEYDGRIAAMATLGEKNGRGDIGLLAVHEDYRGQGLGKQLVLSALHTFNEQDYLKAQVVTQLANQPACLLYEQCGFSIEKVENFYHFWLARAS